MAALHWFECTKGHIFEHFTDQPRQKVKCQTKGCHKLAERVFLSRSQSAAARRFAPSTYFVNSAGHTIFFGRSDSSHLGQKALKELARDGYQEAQISTFREYESFCREQTAIRGRKMNAEAAEERQMQSTLVANAKADLKNGFYYRNKETDEDVFIRYDELQPELRKAVDEQFADYEKELERMYKQVTPDVFIDAFENSNKYYEDRDTDWKRRY